MAATAEAAERRRITGMPRHLEWTAPSLGDLAPDEVADEVALVLVALARLATSGYSDPVRTLWHQLAAELATERDAVLVRLREPNPLQLLTVGGRTIATEGPSQI